MNPHFLARHLFHFAGLTAVAALVIGGALWPLPTALAQNFSPSPAPAPAPRADALSPDSNGGVGIGGSAVFSKPDTSSPGAPVPAPYSRYLDALWQEELSGNLEGALRSYGALVDQFDAQRQRIGAEMLRLGEIEHSTGKSREAREQFGRISREFVDFPELVAAARQYLAISEPDPRLDEQRSLAGIGAVLAAPDGVPKIMELVPGSPASRDPRIQVGDRIAGVAQGSEEFVNTANLKLEQVVQLVRGPIGSTVALALIPPSATNPTDLRSAKIVTLRRAKITLKEPEPPAGAAVPKPEGAIDPAAISASPPDAAVLGLSIRPPDPILPNPDPRNAEYVQLLKEEAQLLEQEIAVTEKQVAAGTVPASSILALKRELLHVRQRLVGGPDPNRPAEASSDRLQPRQ